MLSLRRQTLAQVSYRRLCPLGLCRCRHAGTSSASPASCTTSWGPGHSPVYLPRPRPSQAQPHPQPQGQAGLSTRHSPALPVRPRKALRYPPDPRRGLQGHELRPRRQRNRPVALHGRGPAQRPLPAQAHQGLQRPGPVECSLPWAPVHQWCPWLRWPGLSCQGPVGLRVGVGLGLQSHRKIE